MSNKILFKTGDIVAIKHSVRACASGQQIRNAVAGLGSWADDMLEFMDASNRHGSFKVECYDRNHICHNMTLLSHKRSRCKKGWWVPASCFMLYNPDWLENLPVEIKYE